ncbi:NADH dehydrogenase (ubiquinone) complex I, assembly factor 6 [Kappamyces sp. JEL0829]|nr:NADH dehydrogenase (ubiquinone) complex I, assembly factor 6 [Kappamyces sp. JEL0829]
MSRQYCLDLVRKFDYNSFLVTLFGGSQESQRAFLALRAFNIESAQAQDQASNPDLARMRLEWWKGVVDDCFADREIGHPVAQELRWAVQHSLQNPRGSLSKTWFKRILKERQAHLTRSSFATVDQLESYAEHTASSLLYLQAEILGVRDDETHHALGHLGKSIGTANILRGVPVSLQSRTVLLPSELLAKHDVSTHQLLHSSPLDTNVADVVFDVATRAHDQLLTAKSYADKVDPASLPVLLHALPLQQYLKSLEKADFNLWDARLHQRSLRFIFTLFWAARSGKAL